MLHSSRLLIDEARSWVGTPFQHQQRIKGVACDCAGLLIACARAVGLSVCDVAGYPRQPDGTLRRHLAQQLQRVTDLQPADVLLITTDRVPHHLALYTDSDTLIHANQSRYPALNRVIEHRYAGKWVRWTVGIYRFREFCA